MRLIFLAFGLLLSISGAKSQSLEEVGRRQAAVIEAWEKTPLTVRQAALIKGEPRGYGLYDEHASSEFKKGEHVNAANPRHPRRRHDPARQGADRDLRPDDPAAI